jgi:flagellar motor switch protein FliM
VVLGHETNGRFLQTAPHDTVMLSLSMEARIGDCMEPMQIAFPYYTLEPLIRTLSHMIESKAGPPPGNGDGKARWNPQFDDIRVPVTAQWQDLELAARDLAALKVGDLLEMSPSCLEKVDVQLAETSRFRGRLGKRGKHWAVELTEVLKR